MASLTRSSRTATWAATRRCPGSPPTPCPPTRRATRGKRGHLPCPGPAGLGLCHNRPDRVLQQDPGTRRADTSPSSQPSRYVIKINYQKSLYLIKCLSRFQLTACTQSPLSCCGTSGCMGSIAQLAYTYIQLFRCVTEDQWPSYKILQYITR